jgi:hypothetical protein
MDDFDRWMNEVDRQLDRICGLSHHDLADQCYRDWFDDGVSAEEAARDALESEGFPV